MAHPTDHPLVYEINTRCWLRERAQRGGSPDGGGLDSVRDSEFERWRDLGFTHIWLMGVWPTGPRSRAAALADPALRRSLSDASSDCKEEDFAGSPFAVADYTVAGELGGEPAIDKFRKRLQAHGLGLLLDFVPNHLGLDHSWVAER